MLQKKGVLIFVLLITFAGSGLFLYFLNRAGRTAAPVERTSAIRNTLKADIMETLGVEALILEDGQDINGDGLAEVIGYLPGKFHSPHQLNSGTLHVTHLQIVHLPGRKTRTLLLMDATRGWFRDNLMNPEKRMTASNGWWIEQAPASPRSFRVMHSDTSGIPVPPTWLITWNAEQNRYVWDQQKPNP